MSEYRLSVLAEQDLDDILDYTWEHYGEDQAFAYLEALNRHLAMLADNPLLAVEQKAFDPPVRLFPSGKQTIVYTYQDHYVWVVRFLHQRMDIRRHL